MNNTMISLTVVLGLLAVLANAAPIVAKRDDGAASCPATLRGPSGSAYFAFSTNLSIQTAREACASCYGGSLANVAAVDLQFLGNNLESTSWIKAWNGDDYSSSCLTIQPNAGTQPGVGVDAACASKMWPLCTASAEQVEGLQRIEEEQPQTGEETISTLAVPYKQEDAASATETIAVLDATLAPTKVDAEVSTAAPDATRPDGPKVTCPKKPEGTHQTDGACIEETQEALAVAVVNEEPTKVEVEDNAVVPDATHPIEPTVTCPKKSSGDYQSKNNCIQSEEVVAAVVVEEPTKVAAGDNAVVPDATGPISPDVTCPRGVNGQIQTGSNCVVPEEAAVVVQEESTALVAPAAEPVAPTAAEPPAPATAEVLNPTPAAAAEIIDALTVEKEKLQAAFEADTGSCSSQLALGEQDPLINEYMIETLSETVGCSEARQDAITADVQARVARYEAAQTALQVPPSSA